MLTFVRESQDGEGCSLAHFWQQRSKILLKCNEHSMSMNSIHPDYESILPL